jgi:hypothetical protein
LPRRLSMRALAGSTIRSPLRWELVPSQLALCSAPPLGAHLSLQPYAPRRRLRRCRRCGWSLIKPPQTGTAAGHTHKQKARTHTRRWSRKEGHSGVAARTRLGHERGGSLLLLAQLQTTTTPNHAGRIQRPRTGGRWTDIALGLRASAQSGEGDIEELFHRISPRRRSVVDRGQKQRTRADGSALASPQSSAGMQLRAGSTAAAMRRHRL